LTCDKCVVPDDIKQQLDFRKCK